jgi:hypothetical protein
MLQQAGMIRMEVRCKQSAASDEPFCGVVKLRWVAASHLASEWRPGDSPQVILLNVSHYPYRAESISGGKTYHMITHSDKQIKEQFPALLHLQLHGATPLERVPAPDDQSEVVGSQLGIRVGCLGVCVAGRCEDRAHLDAGLEALFAEGESGEFWEVVADGCAAEHSLACISR